MTILSDIEISRYGQAGMITPYLGTLIRRVENRPVISFGPSSYGYDLRLSPREFLVFRHVPGTVINPKAFNPANLEAVPLQEDEWGQFFVLPHHSYGLGVAMEHLHLPPSITGVCLGKSTYARCGLIVNATPAEAGWHGHLTLEFSNASDTDVRIYAGEGICQMLFFDGEPCSTSYQDRTGKYQGQPESVTIAKA